MDPPPPSPEPGPPRSTRRRRVGLALAVGALTVIVAVSGVALLLEAARPRSTASVGGGRIAVVEANGTLRTVDATGGAERRYSLPGGQFQFPAWAPDGRHLATVGVVDATGSVYVLDEAPASDPLPEPVYESAEAPPFYLYWSPDGGRITFLTSEADGLALRSAAADGSAPASVVRRGAPMYWDWAADDRLFIHAGGDGPDAYLGEVGLDGAEARRDAVAPGRFQAPAVSSDGRRRAYVVATDPPAEVIVVEDAGDGSVRRVAVVGTTALGWSPVTDRLAFLSPRGAQAFPVGPLHVLDASATRSRELLDEDVLAFFWSPDGNAVAALALPREAPQEIASRGSSPVRPAPVAAAPPGAVLQLVVVDAETGARRLDRPVRLSDLFVRQLLPFFDQYALSHSLWSPEADALVLPLVGDDERTRATIVPLDGGEPLPIAEGEVAFWGP